MYLADRVYSNIETQARTFCGAATSARSKALDLSNATYAAVECRAIAIRDVLTSTGEKAQRHIEENTMVVLVLKKSHALVDTLDMLLDRYLPDPEATDAMDGAAPKTIEPLIPRMLRIPVKIPARTIRIAMVRSRDGYNLLQIKVTWAMQLTHDQKEKLKSLVRTKSKAIADKASSSSLAVALQHVKCDASQNTRALFKSIDAGKRIAGAKCHLVYEQLCIIEIKDWTIKTFDTTREVASNALTGASQRIFDVAALLGGREKVKGIFAVVGKRLPFVKSAIRESASSGALSDTSSTEPCTEPGSLSSFDRE
jgi:hypothetical protein